MEESTKNGHVIRTSSTGSDALKGHSHFTASFIFSKHVFINGERVEKNSCKGHLSERRSYYSSECPSNLSLHI